MKKIFYEKVGRRYVPVNEYDQTLMDSFPKGTHIIMCYPGGQSTRYNIDPNYAAMIAAGRLAEDAIAERMHKICEIRRRTAASDKKPLTESQQAAWDNLIKEFGEDARHLEWASIREVAESGVKAMQEEADRLMKHDSVRKAYDRFQLMCKLTAEQNENTN